MPLRVLLRLGGGFGLGDCVQASAWLKHLRKYKPDWQITVISPRGSHSALHGLCEQSLYYGQPEPKHDLAMDLELHEAYRAYDDRPCNKTAYFLPMTFGIEYDHALARYEVRVSEGAQARVGKWLRHQAQCDDRGRYRAVVLHYQGGSSKARKDLEHWQAQQIVDAVRQMGRTPILLDWDRSPVGGVGVPDAVWGGFGMGDAESMAALIGVCEAFVGIDSGPGKVTSATDTPSLICWTKNHPLRYHDPAPNTCHLVPREWRSMSPVDGDQARAAYFSNHYLHIPYSGPHGLVGCACAWLGGALNEGWNDPGVTFVVTPGDEQARWAVPKIRALSGRRPVKVIVSADRCSEERTPGVLAYREQGWVVECRPVPVHMGPDRPVNTRGHVLYVSDGFRDGYHFLCPDTILQLGKGPEEWLPDVCSQQT